MLVSAHVQRLFGYLPESVAQLSFLCNVSIVVENRVTLARLNKSPHARLGQALIVEGRVKIYLTAWVVLNFEQIFRRGKLALGLARRKNVLQVIFLNLLFYPEVVSSVK